MSAKQKGHNAIEAEAKEKKVSKNVDDRTVTEEITAVLEEIIDPNQRKSKVKRLLF